jgi:hypothetical protein
MATKVDPFVIPIPSVFNKDPEIRKYFEYLNRFNHDMWVRSGAGVDSISLIVSDNNRKADTLLYSVLDKVSLGDDLTADDTSLTADNINFTADMTES